MIALESVYTNVTGTHPDVLAVNSTGAATPDGTEFIAEGINNESFGFVQALMNWANGGTNVPGAVGVPSGVTESAEVSQLLDAVQKGHAIGPGFSYPRYINDAPSVHGDRSILLAEQGVLIATYPDLDDAVWITGNTAAQIAAEAAGEKFYRSSDAGGATGDAAGPYLQLPAGDNGFLKQYLGDTAGALDFIVTSSPAVVAVQRAVAIPYQTIDGAWRLRFNIRYTVASASRTSAVMTLSGIVNKTGADQAITAFQGSSSVVSSNLSKADTGIASFTTHHASVVTSLYLFSGDIELDSKPTWADDFEIPWAITY